MANGPLVLGVVPAPGRGGVPAVLQLSGSPVESGARPSSATRRVSDSGCQPASDDVPRRKRDQLFGAQSLIQFRIVWASLLVGSKSFPPGCEASSPEGNVYSLLFSGADVSTSPFFWMTA